MAKKRAAAKGFPEQVYVWRDEDEGYLLADEGIGEAEEGQSVAVYALVKVLRKTVEHKLID